MFSENIYSTRGTRGVWKQFGRRSPAAAEHLVSTKRYKVRRKFAKFCISVSIIVRDNLALRGVSPAQIVKRASYSKGNDRIN
jgi:hypothetical protein